MRLTKKDLVTQLRERARARKGKAVARAVQTKKGKMSGVDVSGCCLLSWLITANQHSLVEIPEAKKTKKDDQDQH